MKRVMWLVIFLSVTNFFWAKVGFAQESSRIFNIQCDGPDVISKDAESVQCAYAAVAVCTEEQVGGSGGYVQRQYKTGQLAKVERIEFFAAEATVYLVGQEMPLTFPWKNPFFENYWIVPYGDDDSKRYHIFYFYMKNPGCAFHQARCSKAVAMYVPDRYVIRISNLFDFKGEVEEGDIVME